jgi:Skp family chaperone for outer membrane proteins
MFPKSEFRNPNSEIFQTGILMKHLTMTFLALILGASAALGQTAAAPAAQKPAPVPGTKIAIIDMRKAITESEPGLAASSEYKKALAPETAVLEKLSKEAAELSEKLKNAKTDPERQDLTRLLEVKQRDGQRAQEDAQKKSEELQDKLLPPIAELVNKAVVAYAMETGLAVVFDPTTEPNNVIHFNTAADITNEVIRRVDAEYAKKGKPAAPAIPLPTTKD